MHIDWWTLALQTINVLVLVWILQRFLLKPVAAIIEARQAAAAKLLADAEGVKAAAEAERQKASEEAAKTAAGRDEVLKAAAAQGETARAAMLSDARNEADKVRLAANAEIERSRKENAVADEAHARALAVDIARKLFSRLPDDAKVSGFIDGLADAVAALPQESRSGVANGAPLALKAPRPLTATEEETCRARLSAAFGHPVDITVVSDPELIAGLEIDTRHALVRNSFRADLDRIAEELGRGAATS